MLCAENLFFHFRATVPIQQIVITSMVADMHQGVPSKLLQFPNRHGAIRFRPGPKAVGSKFLLQVAENVLMVFFLEHFLFTGYQWFRHATPVALTIYHIPPETLLLFHVSGSDIEGSRNIILFQQGQHAQVIGIAVVKCDADPLFVAAEKVQALLGADEPVAGLQKILDKLLHMLAGDSLLGIDMPFVEFLFVFKYPVKEKTQQGRPVPVQAGQAAAQGLLDLFAERHGFLGSGGCYNCQMNRQDRQIELDHSSARTVFLATGLQSSGSTLVSWCFLQRPDMNGTLDGDTDLIPLPPADIQAPLIWYKTTISCFTLAEQIALLEDEGYQVKPTLIVRDVRAVWMSLMKKTYGRNGVTAEDPPLRLRLRRFYHSWQDAVARNIPLFRFEDLLVQPETSLKTLCGALGLPWRQEMLDWPKPGEQIADSRHGNARFMGSDKQGLQVALDPGIASQISGQIHGEDLAWLEETFRDYNLSLDYPVHLENLDLLPGRSLPSWEASRRLHWRLRQKPLRYIFCKLGLSRYQPRPQ